MRHGGAGRLTPSARSDRAMPARIPISLALQLGVGVSVRAGAAASAD
jgi:hypothetical protein